MFKTTLRSLGLGFLLCALALSVLIGVPTVSNAQIARMEIYSSQTMTLTDQEFLIGRKEGDLATISRASFATGGNRFNGGVKTSR